MAEAPAGARPGVVERRRRAMARTTLAELRSPEASRAADPGAALKATLRPYQRAGVAVALAAHRLGLGACLADDMGLGKTIQVLALLLLLKRQRQARRVAAGRARVAARQLAGRGREASPRRSPSSSLHPSALADDETVERAPPETRRRPTSVDHDLRHALPLRAGSRDCEWTVAVLDEAQAIKNPGAKQTRRSRR